jgi:DNA segregation ATPase FtsK/SpoIIIE-like protein
VAPDLPASVWHPYADGSSGNPLSPAGDPGVIPLGVAMGGEQVVWKPKSNPHLLAVGTTGGGKSGVIRAVMEHLLLWRDSWSILMIDPKFVEFSEYQDFPVAVDRVALELDESLELLRHAHGEMVRRQRLLKDNRVQNIDELNAALGNPTNGEPHLKRIMIVVDEVAELLDRSGGKSEEAKEQDAMRDECSAIFESIARLGRAMGVHLLYATQRNDAKLISGQVRNNTMARIAVGRLSPEGSRMALENDFATGLPGMPGRGIYYEFGQCRELQVYRVDQEQIRDMLGAGEPQGVGT